jgi:hypothetical protein
MTIGDARPTNLFAPGVNDRRARAHVDRYIGERDVAPLDGMKTTTIERALVRAFIESEVERVRNAMDLEDARAEMREYLGVERTPTERAAKAAALAERILNGIDADTVTHS